MSSDISVGVAAGYGVMGFAIVFFGLVLLMIVIFIIGKIMHRGEKPAANGPEAPSQATAAPEEKKELAPGSAGSIELINVSDRDAALIMAIVADKMQKPLNELRFKSIREVK